MAQAGLWIPGLAASVTPGPHKSAERDLNWEFVTIKTRQSKVQDCISTPSAAGCVRGFCLDCQTVHCQLALLPVQNLGTGLAPTETNIISRIMSPVRWSLNLSPLPYSKSHPS